MLNNIENVILLSLTALVLTYSFNIYLVNNWIKSRKSMKVLDIITAVITIICFLAIFAVLV